MDEHGQSTTAVRPPAPGRNRLLLALAVLGLVGTVLSLFAAQGMGSTPTTLGLAGYNAAATASPASAKTIQVTMKGYAFQPAALTINAGDTVTWTNEDTAPHNVTISAGPETFASPNLQKGQTFSYTFTKAGTYNYYCSVHPDMTATVTVQGGATTSNPAPQPSGGSAAAPTTPAPATGGMPMPMPAPAPAAGNGGSAAGACVPKAVLTPLFQHIEAAHLQESPGQQAADLLNADQWIKTHTVLIDNMAAPAFSGGPSAVEAVLTPLIQHIEAAHLQESPGQQVADLANLDQWLLTHQVVLEQMLKPVLAQADCGGATNCAAGSVLTPLIQHIESAHLEESPGQQVADLANLDQWIKTHTVLLDNMFVPAADGSVTTASAVLAPLVQHIESAHLQESPGQQVLDLLSLDQWTKTHTVLLDMMLSPAFEQAAC